MRPLVYYLIEDLVSPEWARDRDVLDFSAGLGDLSRYLLACGARSVVATHPDPREIDEENGVTWRGGVAAGRIAASLGESSFDLAVARMVFQFPTWEGDRADPDTMAVEFGHILRPGGRLVLAFHEFLPFETVPTGSEPSIDQLLDAAGREGQASIVRFLELPPREGPFGETGFGLKVPMLVTSLQRAGFEIEIADHAEPFTMPLHLDGLSDAEIAGLGSKVMAIKRGYLSDPDQSPYDRPGAVRSMLSDLGRLFEFATWPIVRVVARLRA